MWRKLLLLVGVLVLVLATAGVALAEPKPRDERPGKGNDKPVVTPVAGVAATGTPIALHGRAFRGTIKAVDTSNNDVKWTVTTQQYGDLVVSVKGADVKWAGRKNADLTAFAVGDEVVVQLTGKPGATLTARRVHLIPGSAFVHVTGQLTGVSGNTITIKKADGTSVTFNTLDTTTVKAGPQVTVFKGFVFTSYVSANSMVTVVAREGTAPQTATAIVLHGNPTAGNGDQDNKGQGQNKDKDEQDDD